MTSQSGFIRPEYLWSFLALIPLAILWTFAQRYREAKLSRFTVKENWALLSANVSTRARFHRGLLILLALSFSIIAAARPYMGVREREVRKRGINMLFAVDVSKSMLSDDVTPTRLEYARTLVRQLLAEFKGQRVGLLPFAGEAFLQCPLTTDYGVLLGVLKRMDVSTVAYQGTDIPEAIDTAIDAFDRSGEGNRVLVFLTDGENHGDEIKAAAQRAAEKKIRIYVLGIGTPQGGQIKLPDRDFKRDENGVIVTTKLNSDLLRDLADLTGGKAYAGGSNGMIDVSPLIADLTSLEKGELGDSKREVREERFQWPLGLALLCLAIEALLSERRRVAVRRQPAPNPKPALAA